MNTTPSKKQVPTPPVPARPTVGTTLTKRTLLGEKLYEALMNPTAHAIR
jgi:hypothetical protein